MSRIVLLLFLVVLGFWWVSSRLRRSRDGDASSKRRAAPAEPLRDMVACAHCGVHLPRDEAVVDGKRLFCGDAHRRLGPRAE